MAVAKSGVSAGSGGDKPNQGRNLFIRACARPVEAGPLVLGQVAQSHFGGVAGIGSLRVLYDGLNIGLGVCRGRGVCIINRIRGGDIHIHLCIDFRRGLAYAGMFCFFRGCLRPL